MRRTRLQNLGLTLIVLYVLGCLTTLAGSTALALGYDEPVFKAVLWPLLLMCLAASLGHRLWETFGFDIRRKRQGRPAQGFEHLRGYFLGYPPAEDDAVGPEANTDEAKTSRQRQGK